MARVVTVNFRVTSVIHMNLFQFGFERRKCPVHWQRLAFAASVRSKKKKKKSSKKRVRRRTEIRRQQQLQRHGKFQRVSKLMSTWC